nr:hypothetical protein [Lachnospiraceae bacterium]
GYTHCLLGSHFILFLSLIMVVLLDQIKIWMAAVILAANYIMYVYTDAKTTMILSVAFVALVLVARFLKKRRNAGRICAGLMSLIPMVFFAGSAYITKIFRWDSAFMVRLNGWLNGRLGYAGKAWEEYGMTLFGQRIKWIGESVVKDNPDRIYNYVDNAYMQAFFSYGLVFVLFLCAGWGLVLYRRMREGDYIMAAAVLIVLVHGLINPQMIELAYNPFFLLIGYEFARCRGVRIGKEK